jgi:hypothetical protein
MATALLAALGLGILIDSRARLERDGGAGRSLVVPAKSAEKPGPEPATPDHPPAANLPARAHGKIDESTPVSPKAPSSDVEAPVSLTLGEVVASRLADSWKPDGMCHFWRIDLPPGRYKIVLDVRNANGDFRFLNPTIGGQLHGVDQSGQPVSTVGEFEDEGPRCRKVFPYYHEVEVHAILRYANRFSVADYELGIFPAENPVRQPFFALCPEVKPLKLGESVTTPPIGNQQPMRDAYCSITLPAGDYTVTAEFRDIDGINRGGVGGEVHILDANGDTTDENRIIRSVAFDRPQLKDTAKLALADERALIFRIRAQANGDTQEVVIFTVDKR